MICCASWGEEKADAHQQELYAMSRSTPRPGKRAGRRRRFQGSVNERREAAAPRAPRTLYSEGTFGGRWVGPRRRSSHRTTLDGGTPGLPRGASSSVAGTCPGELRQETGSCGCGLPKGQNIDGRGPRGRSAGGTWYLLPTGYILQ